LLQTWLVSLPYPQTTGLAVLACPG